MQRITVVAPNRTGVLAEVTDVLARKGISISSISADTLGSEGLIHIDLEDADPAVAALTAAGHQTVTEDVLLARIADKPGAVAELSRRLLDARLDIRALNMVQRQEGWAVIAVSTNDNAAARKVLAGDAI
ncbi:MAG TPA: ACT domain-containing protein [Candidatus Baltobacteraceae bacterium]|nr:ACT domain-containing protein [Candidatus Baltobacteraceae bacterium]